MCGHVGHLIDPADDPFVVDQERDSSGEFRGLIIAVGNDVVGGTHGGVDIAQQGVVEALRLGELEVLGGRVERSADDGAVGFGELFGAVTQRLSLDGSTACRRLGIPPQQHPSTAEMGKAYVGGVLIGKAEFGCFGSGDEHVHTLRRANCRSMVAPMAENPYVDLWPRVRGWLAVAGPWVSLVVAKLWLVDGQRLTAYGSLTIDDQWFVERASWITVGEWLGPFDAHTLIKQPGYPMFVAAAHAVKVPLLLAHQLVYVFAIAVMLVAMRSLLPTRRRRLWAFALMLFNPMTMNTPVSARVDRAGLYPALTVLLLACLVGLVSNCDRLRRSTASWAVGASVSVGALWLVREEWLLLLPGLACGLLLAIGRLLRAPLPTIQRVGAVVAVACVPVSILVGTVWLQQANESRYGVRITNVEQTSMSAGLGPTFRVEPATTFDQFPVTVETRELIYTVSPHFADLRDEIERGGGLRYASIRPDGVRDLGGQVFQWVVLDAIGATGHAMSAVELDAMFRSIADEIDAACADGRLRCSAPHSGIAPAWQWNRLPGLMARTVTGLRKTVDLGAFSALSPDGDGTAADRALFARMTGEPLAPGPNGFFTRQRVHLISALRWLYRLLAVAAVVVALAKARSALRSRRAPSWTMLTVVSVGALLVLVRVIGLAYLDLTTFPAFAPTYLASAYAVTVVVAVAVGSPAVGVGSNTVSKLP